MKTTVAVFYGGRSVEHEVSVISALQAISALDKEKYFVIPVYISKNGSLYSGEYLLHIEHYRSLSDIEACGNAVTLVSDSSGSYLVRADGGKLFDKKRVLIDVAFPIVHGVNIEDGTLAGFLHLHNLPYVGSDVLSSAVCMNKYTSKLILQAFSVPVLDCVWIKAKNFFEDESSVYSQVEEKLSYPVIVKPIDLGSSVGIKLAINKEELTTALHYAFLFAGQVIVEHAVTNIKEINCAVLGDSELQLASECEEPISSGFLSYDDKYMSNSGVKKVGGDSGMASLKRKLPADISDKMRDDIQSCARKAFSCLGCFGVVRIDFIIDMDTGLFYLNEINTIPGSLAFYLFEPIGIKYSMLLDRLIALAFKRSRVSSELATSYDTNILSNYVGGTKGGKLGGTKGGFGTKM